MTGETLTALHAAARTMQRFPYRVLKLALVPANRDALRERIAERFDAMLAAGFLDEVKRLHARADLHADLPALRAVGYRQAWDFLGGQGTPEAFRRRAIDATRQLAKRQATWLRSELDARAFDPGASGCGEFVASAVALFLGIRKA